MRSFPYVRDRHVASSRIIGVLVAERFREHTKQVVIRRIIWHQMGPIYRYATVKARQSLAVSMWIVAGKELSQY